MCEVATCNGEIFTGYILFEFLVWFLGWEKYTFVSFVHHGGFLFMGILLRGIEVLVYPGTSAVAMEISSPALVIHMCARQLHGWEEISSVAFNIFAPLFIISRLLCYSIAVGVMLHAYITEFDYFSPRLMKGWCFHLQVWIIVAGGLLQWSWAPVVLSKLWRKIVANPLDPSNPQVDGDALDNADTELEPFFDSSPR